MVRLMMVPHRGATVVAMHVCERHRRGSERGYDEDSKSFLENVFHGNPDGSKGVSDEKRDAKPVATAMRRHFSAVTGSESRTSYGSMYELVQSPADGVVRLLGRSRKMAW
jgi:hypothetical protein